LALAPVVVFKGRSNSCLDFDDWQAAPRARDVIIRRAAIFNQSLAGLSPNIAVGQQQPESGSSSLCSRTGFEVLELITISN
jgi:hypothetical protein